MANTKDDQDRLHQTAHSGVICAEGHWERTCGEKSKDVPPFSPQSLSATNQESFCVAQEMAKVDVEEIPGSGDHYVVVMTITDAL